MSMTLPVNANPEPKLPEFDAIRIRLASPDKIRSWSKGEVTKPAEKQIEVRRSDTTGVGTVLLVEDEDAVRLFSARALRNKGYKVVEAKSGESALELLEKGNAPIDLVVTDVVMPGMDGGTLAGRSPPRVAAAIFTPITGRVSTASRRESPEGTGCRRSSARPWRAMAAAKARAAARDASCSPRSSAR